jgi:hypothetical protein
MIGEDIEIPFVKLGNRRGLTHLQLMESRAICEFFVRFRHCFELHEYVQIWLFIEND